MPTAADFRAIGAIPDSSVIGGGLEGPGEVPKLPPSVSDPLLKLFDRQARGMPQNTYKNLRAKKLVPNKSVRVAVVDATPKGVSAPDHSMHGFVVSRVIGSLLCADVDSTDCNEQVRPYLALPMLSPTQEDRVNGGDFGSFFQLADALAQAISRWKFQEEHLVINLSIGWDPIKIEISDPKVIRIRRLLEKASCMGALIVAASGNFSGTDGPVLPAGFETIPAPSATECATRFQLPPTKIMRKSRLYAPLVHAVGAVDAMDMRLISDRRWGQPRLSAFGLNVMVKGPAPMAYTPPLTGTSMSAAVVSGVAAAVWSARPKLDATEVMDLVYQGGVELDGGNLSRRAQTEFCVENEYGPCRSWPVRRVYLCGALAKAVSGSVPACNGTPAPQSDMPAWPAPPPGAPKTGKPPSGPCRIAACGVAEGPMANQLLAGVIPHGGLANCPGCTLTVMSPSSSPTLPTYVEGRLAGIPSFTIPENDSVITILKTISNTLQFDSMQIFLSPGINMNTMSQPSVLSDTKSSAIWWYFPSAGSYIREITTLDRGQP